MEGGGGGGGDGSFLPNSSFGVFSETAMDMDFMEELFYDGCWLETTDGKSLKQTLGQQVSDSTTMNDNNNNNSFLYGYQFAENPSQDHISNEETGRKFPPITPGFLKIEDLSNQPLNQVPFDQSAAMSSAQAEKFLLEETEGGRRWWIAPRTSQGPSSSVKDRLVQAIKGLMQDKDFLIQIWVPIQQEGKNFLTTLEQPHFFNPKYLSLKRYRDVSVAYNFPAHEDSTESVGLPGRVFLGKLPEWTPDVRFFRSEEYPRIKEAEKCDVRGSLALPVFERGSGTCLGVVEIVTTTQKMNYRPELDNICKALESVNLRSSRNLKSPSREFLQVYNEFYYAALPEVSEFLTWVCRLYDLPLALTWAPCARQGKVGSRHSDENFSECVSTVDDACIVPDHQSRNFLEACSEHHLLQGEGIVGKAFKATKLFFVPEVITFSKTNYPLAHHAKISGLHAALAVPLKSKFNGSVEFVLEFFFPKTCLDTEAQQDMLKSLSVTVQQDFRSLNLVIDKELELEVVFPVREEVVFAKTPLINAQTGENMKPLPLEEISQEDSSWISHMIKANEKGKGVSLSWEYQKEEPKEEFMLTSGWDNNQTGSGHSNFLSEADQFQKVSNSGLRIDMDPSFESASFGVGQTLLGSRRPGEKRRTKTEKTIGLEVLRQYFAGSLKDAAKSIGVCPTTLKRICRQHGITRWPSRKIKKVGHSLKKLQLVIDSVQGVQGSIQLDSFYTSFPELSSPHMSGTATSFKNTDQSRNLTAQTENGVSAQGTAAAAPKSPPSSSCSHSSGSSTCCSTGANQSSNTGNTSVTTLMAENASAILKRARSEVRLHTMNHEETKSLSRTLSHKTFSEHPLFENLPRLPESNRRNLKAEGASKVKATFGEAKVRFTLLPTWGFRELQHEIARRFNIDNIAPFDLKYLDDDKEWVLLTCEADLEECIDIYRSSQSRTIKISVHEASQNKLGGSFGSIGLGPSL
ncbi:PREDICTED: protein NLP2-like [Camelina sativa]|uniref:Protein NLP2-like n=1 Tax=Camelina sativa TaxID=90675 RepID=A0ABM0UVH8_CAMSA|nr:PREDICTED: protein NLP2-like [Camelina sativa]XP_010446947.1 PREDICTED: protein NLP2-like [Camelina sativa]XP_010446948.1 PREDICTED: protein NLP2-like [Camelina sativa]XP_010446949.1 PREDICTED: protein NLP2-like [Camelina sativa]XP_010446950.1 PREDICTED: protein NLP2-like [Camelina sativa]